MSEEKDLRQAQTVYASLCEMMDERDWNYTKDEDDMAILCGVQGDDLPMPIVVKIDMEHKLIVLLSNLPFDVEENRRPAMAVAVSLANDGMVDGDFDFDFASGKIVFRLTSSYRDSLIGKELFEYMIVCASSTVDKYNDKFLMVAGSDMTVKDIMDFIQ